MHFPVRRRPLSDIDGLLNDFNREISAYLSELTFSEEEYYETEKRLDEINRLKAKYGKTMEEIAAYREEQQKKLEKLENFESCRAALQEQLQKTEQKLDAAAHNLSKIRRNYAKRLETQIIEGLRDLNFLHVAFEISFEKTKSYTENGTDAVEFLISTNPGEAIRPLAKVVSGGELSRIMLAIKTILADRDETETLIFDEIDTGISGRTAQKVSEKMAQIGQRIRSSASPICRRSQRWQILILKSKKTSKKTRPSHRSIHYPRKILSENWQECSAARKLQILFWQMPAR